MASNWWICFLVLCLISYSSADTSEKCPPGTVSFKEDCNTCFCNAAGVPMCTKMLCLGKLLPAKMSGKYFGVGPIIPAIVEAAKAAAAAVYHTFAHAVNEGLDQIKKGQR